MKLVVDAPSRKQLIFYFLALGYQLGIWLGAFADWTTIPRPAFTMIAMTLGIASGVAVIVMTAVAFFAIALDSEIKERP